MQLKGFYLSTDAILSLLLLSALLAAQAPLEAADVSLRELYVLQKENDLLRLWMVEGAFNENAMQRDFAFVFPGSSGKIVIDGREILVGKKGEEGTASSLLFFDSGMHGHRIGLIVFD